MLIHNLSSSMPGEIISIESGQLDNTLGLQRRVRWIFRPSGRNVLKEMLSFFSANKISYHPISTGKNWGFGSQLPAQDDVVILSLEKLNRILSFDPKLGTIRIEPGVTQKQVYDFLNSQQASFYIDVTGSGKDTSLMGNALERGVSYRTQRSKMVLSLEILTADGKQIRTGFSNSHQPISQLYPYGLGPDISGLFFQSSFGVVTEMTLALPKKPEQIVSITANTSPDVLTSFLNSLIPLLQDEIIDFVPHIADKGRFVETALPIIHAYQRKQNIQKLMPSKHLDLLFPQEYIMNATISGSKGVVKEKIKVAKKALQPYARVMVLTPWKERLIYASKAFGPHKFSTIYDALQGLRELSFGIPTDDATISLSDFGSTDPDLATTGFIYVAPLGPLNSETAMTFIEINRTVRMLFQAKTAVTLNPISPHVLECVFSTTFDKKSSDAKLNAEKASQYFLETCDRNGLHAYRLPTATPQRHAYHTNEHSELLAVIKKFFDPDHLLSPDRYV